MLTLKTDYYQQFDADYSLDVPQEGFGGWKTGNVEIDPKHTAVIVMHAWDCGTPEQYPGWFRCCPAILRTYTVCREVFPKLLGAVRASELRLIHVVASGEYYQHYPGYQRAVALAGPVPEPLPQAVKDSIYEKLGRFRSENVFVGKHNQLDVDNGLANMRFPKGAEPQGDEGIARDAHQLAALCRETGVNHLIYAGFNVDWCILMSQGGMLDMSRRGFICSVLRQAVTAIENKETVRHELGKEIALWRISLAFGFVFDVDDFMSAIRKTVDDRVP